ncbi:MAG: hypothetical protein CME62_01835 [Halobacteriovoraceae bacterium]|nr:hypothetical protein [Halobacteriovoraceae bacterium]|tara:strand:+ start:5390 stop:5815 length:426 start_codon:yes stop_codon:yes gene_type:complete
METSKLFRMTFFFILMISSSATLARFEVIIVDTDIPKKEVEKLRTRVKVREPSQFVSPHASVINFYLEKHFEQRVQEMDFFARDIMYKKLATYTWERARASMPWLTEEQFKKFRSDIPPYERERSSRPPRARRARPTINFE